MNLTWIIAGLITVSLLIALNFIGPLKGSGNSDFSKKYRAENNPLPACSDSPNCVRLSIKAKPEAKEDFLYNIAQNILKEMGAEKIETDSQSLQLKAVFTIPLFGFKDDVDVKITPSGNSSAAVHLTSRSRTGYSDLGVNRRRAKAFIRKLNNHI